MEVFEKILEIIGFNLYVRPIASGFIVAMATVYVSGKMLGFAKTHAMKNTIAFTSILIYASCEWLGLVPVLVQNILMTSSGIIVLYTLIGMRMFDHLNKYQDSRFGEAVYEDESGKEVVLKRKKPQKKVKINKK
jgi:hypothetical protein